MQNLRPGILETETRKPGTQFLTKVEGLPVVLRAEDVSPAVSAGAEVFESLHDVDLHAAHNEIQFYTWGDKACCLPKGATRATLLYPHKPIELKAGDLLLFEEVEGPESGEKVDADPNHRHVVRLTLDPLPITDSLVIDGKPPQQLLEVEWAHEDALPFPLCLSTEKFPDVSFSVARGNVVLVDHGRTLASKPLAPIPEPERGDYRPALQFGPLAQQGYMRDRRNQLMLFDSGAPASAAFRWQIQTVKPAIWLKKDADVTVWSPQRELLNSGRFTPEFVVETENDGRAYLRFGDGVLGRKPVDGLSATYRVGNGRTGNVGANAIAHVVTDLAGIGDVPNPVRNPLPAQGGTEPETLEQVRLYAPQAFRTQERAVTEADYAVAAGRHPDVQQAAATRRWTGSWYTLFVTIDRKGGRPVDADFRKTMRQFLERFRLAGYDLEIQSPIFVPLDIAFTVCVKPGYFRSNVKKALLEAFSNTDLPDGRRGFFHPDNFTFGTPVYLSQIVATALRVPGVNWIDTEAKLPNRFQRWGQDPHGELAAGEMNFARLEIARLDNDPNQPENGKLELFMQGGL